MKSYKIRTTDDIVKAVNANNIDGFLEDFELWLRMSIEIKKISVPGFDVQNKGFTWNDDNENGVSKGVEIEFR